MAYLHESIAAGRRRKAPISPAEMAVYEVLLDEIGVPRMETAPSQMVPSGITPPPAVSSGELPPPGVEMGPNLPLPPPNITETQLPVAAPVGPTPVPSREEFGDFLTTLQAEKSLEPHLYQTMEGLLPPKEAEGKMPFAIPTRPPAPKGKQKGTRKFIDESGREMAVDYVFDPESGDEILRGVPYPIPADPMRQLTSAIQGRMNVPKQEETSKTFVRKPIPKDTKPAPPAKGDTKVIAGFTYRFNGKEWQLKR